MGSRRDGIARATRAPVPRALNIARVVPAAGASSYSLAVTRDRRGRGIRGPLVARRLPISTSPADRFDRIASSAIEHVEHRWREQLADVEFAVDLVPSGDVDAANPAMDGAIESAGVLLAQILPGKGRRPTHIVLYRKPIELRARGVEDLEDLVHDIVVQVIANYLGLEPDVVDPGFGPAS